MPSQKIVRCLVRPVRGFGPMSARYVPLEIYGLWEFLMRNKHGFEVVEPCASLWLDADDAPEAAYGEERYDRVTEVAAFVYSDRDGMFTRALRYFPTDQCRELRKIFLAHYHEAGKTMQVRERSGMWLHRETADALT